MSERGVCICPECGCQFSDDQKAKYERLAKRDGWKRRPVYRLRVWWLSRRLRTVYADQGASPRKDAER